MKRGITHLAAVTLLGLLFVTLALFLLESTKRGIPPAFGDQGKPLVYQVVLGKDNGNDIENQDIVQKSKGTPYNIAFARNVTEQYLQGNALNAEEAYRIVNDAIQLLSSLPTLVRLDVPSGGKVVVCGDTHGNFHDMHHVMQLEGYPSDTVSYLFTGDYVDRGASSLGNILTLLSWKLALPDRVHLLRGNHESIPINEWYGFQAELFVSYSAAAVPLWSLFGKLYGAIPTAALVANRVLALHGGPPSESGTTLSDIEAIDRFHDPPPEGSMLNDILWSDPHDGTGRLHSPRGSGWLYGSDITNSFLSSNNLDFIIRAHEPRMMGYSSQHNDKIYTLFTAGNYCEMANEAGYMVLEANLKPQLHHFEAQPHPAGKLPECQRFLPIQFREVPVQDRFKVKEIGVGAERQIRRLPF